MTNRPIIPTRIIPAGAPLPDRGPLPGEVPPWWEKPAAPTPPPPPVQPPAVAVAPPAPEPLPPQVHVHVVLPYEPEPDPTRWQRLTALIQRFGRPWQICGALTLALLPIPGTEYSAATTWAYAVSQARDTWGQSSGYALALTPLAIALIRLSRGGTLPRLLLLTVSLVGVTGAIHAYDPITWITGVHPS